MNPTVRTAVIPAAGLGTRFLPATKAQPKEMLPVVDRPAIQYVVEEAMTAGLDDVLIVTSRGKSVIEDHFDRMPDLEAELERKDKSEALAAVVALAQGARMHYVRQGEPLGLGHAVGMAADHVGQSPFAVLLPDDLMVDDAALLRGMLGAHAERGASVIALKRVPSDEISAYGCPRIEAVDGPLVRIHEIVEKPSPEEAPSDLAVTGRYVFTPAIFEALDKVEPGKGGEIQLTDAIGVLSDSEPVYGWTFSDGRFDVGTPLDHLRATVEIALARPELRSTFGAFLADAVRRHGLG
ncbi:MAG: UTP--glucose-1-phosphate uridylyltransferase GalU [Actinobacteria bacterium]|nr:UTP--glucose-1-phosphate uridylyltransferase GalU [Actinomycetota bacterium]MBW3641511.1 UTP--glucose-1-phosphate uridylyltransferase GalU [Actinomycetota bacterium]